MSCKYCCADYINVWLTWMSGPVLFCGSSYLSDYMSSLNVGHVIFPVSLMLPHLVKLKKSLLYPLFLLIFIAGQIESNSDMELRLSFSYFLVSYSCTSFSLDFILKFHLLAFLQETSLVSFTHLSFSSSSFFHVDSLCWTTDISTSWA